MVGDNNNANNNTKITNNDFDNSQEENVVGGVGVGVGGNDALQLQQQQQQRPSSSSSTIEAEKEEEEGVVVRNMEAAVLVVPEEVTTNEVIQCQFSYWYPTFSNIVVEVNEEEYQEDGNTKINNNQRNPKRRRRLRKNVTIKSVIIESLPEDFIEYLLCDGIQIPIGCANAASNNNNNDDSDDDDDDWSEDDNDDDDSSHHNDIKQFHFPILNEQIQNAISTLNSSNGGGVIPKLNWSSPKDATWVNGGTLKCLTVSDVYVLIKSSDFCLHDIMEKNSIKDCIDYYDGRNDNDNNNEKEKEENNNNNDNNTTTKTTTTTTPIPIPPLQLVLRKWCNLNPSMEFRCFVRDHELLAISQRNHTQHYPHLGKDEHQINNTIQDFFDEYIKHKFASGQNISKYVVDLYIDQKNKPWILDFNIFGKTTDPLLFDWNELMNMKLTKNIKDDDDDDDDDESYDDDSNDDSNDDRDHDDHRRRRRYYHRPIFRIVETANQVRHDPLASYRAPIDTVDLANMMKGDAKEFEEFMKKQSQLSSTQDDDDDDDEN